MTKPHPTNVELCGGRYTALRHEGAIYLFAVGFHEALGYRVFFKALEPETAGVPEFRLWHKKPEPDAELPVASPFCERTKFTRAGPVEHVVVHDAYGRHEVTVEDQPDWAPLT